ncbi:glycoside hydrolase family 73 protein [Yokenella regensburgei]|uniref:glycoside hydrolase family 73 protein n=1 Tax=Yokenella regensburgei TaxID=158877 RepID=UPI0035B06294
MEKNLTPSSSGTTSITSTITHASFPLCIRDFPVPKNNRGHAFSHPSDMLAHLEGEATGHWLIGSNGMWHPGIHITDATTPWCALSGKAAQEVIQYPVPYKGEQAIRCMADGEVVAYRINRDYLAMPWMMGDLAYSTTFVLVRHRIQPGQTAASALTFYTLYMHLAPWSAYPEESPTYKVADGQRLNAYVDGTLMWTAATLKPGTRVNWNTADPAARMKANGREYARVSLVEGITDKMSLNAGDHLWVVCDNGNLVPDGGGPVRPAWWANLLPPAKDTMQFDTVVCPTPYPIKAGDAIGHLGYYQAPTDSGSEGRYQVHIECFTADDLPHFLTNPEGAGRDAPTFARYPKGIRKYLESISRTGVITTPQIELTTNQAGIFALADSHRVVSDGVAYWQNGGEGWYLAESDLTMLSRYDLTARGFESTEANPTSFDHLDGVNQPQGLVRYIYQKLFDVSSKDPRTSHALVRYNYQRLLDNIDRGEKHYSAQEYLQAVQNQSYLEHLQRLCVKHPADWYHGAEDPIWQTFFTPLFKKESPLWYRYSINFLTATRWMNQVPGMVAEPWYMHPIVFLDAININLNSKKPIDKEFVEFVFDEAKKDELTSHVPAAITTAQAILETGYGKSVPVDIYTGEYSNNLFGIKAHGNSDFIYVNTHEFINGVKKPIVDKFIKYDSYEESISGRTDFFVKNKRYHFLFDYTDPCDWARGLQRAGYATDPNYADKLIKIMKRENLL